MLLLLAAHAMVIAALPSIVRRWGSRGFLLAALPPAGVVGYVVMALPGVLGGEPVVETLRWAPGLGLSLTMRLDPLSAAVALLVGGVGTAVMVYSAAYFEGQRPGRTAAALLGFAGAMLGLVLSDDLLALYVFWELTTVASFVLIGHSDEDEEARRSATQALLITTATGLVMLLGFVLIGELAGTYSISAVLADPPSGPLVTAAVVCVLVGAFAKSAQVPFHGWLPAAMIAPTPVSAFLHGAAMVNAGVYLVARLAPGLAGNPAWQPLVLIVGVTTLLLGGWRALRQTDLKRLLAFSTVSQLGFLIVLLGEGTRTAALAGLALLLAHGVAKAALFLVAGAVEHETGTRELPDLSGLWRATPWLAVLAVLAGASLAGVPLLFGGVAKEAAFVAFEHGGAATLTVLAGLLAGSVLTVAYVLRLLAGAFGGPPVVTARSSAESERSRPAATPWALAGPLLPLAAAALLGLAAPAVDGLVAPYADQLPVAAGGDPDYHLKVWPGPTMALGLSALVLALGTLLHGLARPRAQLQRRAAAALPGWVDVDRGYRWLLDGLQRAAMAVTARVQVGSPPVYLMVVALTVLALPGSALIAGVAGGTVGAGTVQPWSTVPEAALAGLVLAAAVALALLRNRLAVVLVLGVVGYGVAGLFVLRSAPDLALTQLLVETLTLVAFVLVLRRLPEQRDEPHTTRRWAARAAVGTVLGGFVGALGLVAAGARSAPPVSEQMIAGAKQEAGAKNVVNAILVDFRAMDTIGEISVLLVAIVGVASLVLITRRTVHPVEPADRAAEAEQAEQEVSP